MPKGIQYGIAIESAINIYAAVYFLIWPEYSLSSAVSPLSSLSTLAGVAAVPASTATLFQVYAVLVLSLTTGLLLCMQERPGVREARIILFQTLGLTEVLMVGLLLWKAMDAEKSGFKYDSLVQTTVSLVPVLVWRIWALYIMPDMLGEPVKPVAAGKKNQK
jgi:hypothetical protein